MKIKISIMITCYNCEEYIDKAISSVVSQDKPFSWEVLIGDDGSDDNTVECVQKWINKYPKNIKLFRMDRTGNSEKNGTRAARNRANLLEHACGEYLTFLDGDDQFLGNEKLRKQIEILDYDVSEDYSCVAHDILANDITNGFQYALSGNTVKEGVIDTSKYWKELYFHTNTIVFRNKCKKMMLENRYKDYLNDNFITYIILQYGKIYYLPEVWAQYNLTGNGLWTGKKRTYGCFRNMILYDLELEINSELKKESFIRHLYDFKYIFKNYNIYDREKVAPLVTVLPEERFYYTKLLYKSTEERTKNERIHFLRLKLYVEIALYKKRVFNLVKKVIKKL